ncbi:MAG TPA: CCC motif membrane protein [Puia sp.]|nr:CCC motif membrane protein [Puia sp.]
MDTQNPLQQFSPGPQRALPNSTAVLVLGIISIVGCFCYGIVGLVCGIIALVLAKKDSVSYEANPALYTSGSYSNLKAGRVCAIVGVSLSSIYVVIVIIYIIAVGTAILTNPEEIFHHHFT